MGREVDRGKQGGPPHPSPGGVRIANRSEQELPDDCDHEDAGRNAKNPEFGQRLEIDAVAVGDVVVLLARQRELRAQRRPCSRAHANKG